MSTPDYDDIAAQLAKVDEIVTRWRTGIYSAQEAILTIESWRQRDSR